MLPLTPAAASDSRYTATGAILAGVMRLSFSTRACCSGVSVGMEPIIRLQANGEMQLLMSQSRPLRSIHRDGGWTVQTVAERLVPAFAADLYPLEVSADVFSWDPL